MDDLYNDTSAAASEEAKESYIPDIEAEEPYIPDIEAEEPYIPDIEIEDPHIPGIAEKELFYKETIKNETDKRKRSQFHRNLLTAILISVLGGLCLGLGIGIGIPVAQHYFLGNDKKAAADQEEDVALTFNNAAEAPKEERFVFGDNLSDIVSMVEPSVVSIVTVAESKGNFFSQPFQESGAGSGIIFSQDRDKLYIVTNYHVIGGASEVFITKDESQQVSAKLVGEDRQADLAVISVLKSDLKEKGIHNLAIAIFGDSDISQVGETVLAIGNAIGMGNTATVGIISAKDKTIEIQNRTFTMIQTDAAINEGNSGGPLINTRGEVIGINTAKISLYSVEGMGYSITANVAKPIIEGIMKRVTGAFLGISGRTMTAELAELYDLPELGVLVEYVFPGSGAEKAGIKQTDIIVSINGENMFTMAYLSETIQSFQIGQEIQVKLIRDGKNPMTVKVKLEAYPDMDF